MTPVFACAWRKGGGNGHPAEILFGVFRRRKKIRLFGKRRNYSASGPVMTPVTAEAAATQGLAR